MKRVLEIILIILSVSYVSLFFTIMNGLEVNIILLLIAPLVVVVAFVLYFLILVGLLGIMNLILALREKYGEK